MDGLEILRYSFSYWNTNQLSNAILQMANALDKWVKDASQKEAEEEYNHLSSLADTLQETTQILTEWEEKIKPIFDNLDRVLETKKPDTPYKSKIKLRLFDKRLRIHFCRSNC